MCAARDPIAHYYTRDYALRSHARELTCLAELILAIYEKNSPIRQIKIPTEVSCYTVCG